MQQLMAEGAPQQVDTSPHQAESRGPQHGTPLVIRERRGDREGSVRTTYTEKSQSKGKSHVSHAKDDRDMQREINMLKRELRYERRKRTTQDSKQPSDESDDTSYRRWSRTLPSELFSQGKEHYSRQTYKSPPRQGLGNEALNKALSQVSKSPFT